MIRRSAYHEAAGVAQAAVPGLARRSCPSADARRARGVITHRSEKVQIWHAKPKKQRVIFHFIPTYSSWLNLVEVPFNLVQAKVIRRGRFPSKQDLTAKLLAYIERFNQEKRIFQWTKTPEGILRSCTSVTQH